MCKLKTYIQIFFLLIAITTKAQNSNTNSPYSRFGIGEIASNVFGQNYAMGGTSIGMRDPDHLNPNNPASYSSFDSTIIGAPFIFEFGFSNVITNLSSSNNTYTGNNTNLNYLSIGYPYTKWWFGNIGLKPYSNVGYKIITTENNPNIGNVEYCYNGSGGINNAYIGNSIKPFEFLSIGFNANYLYGFIKQTNTLTFTDDDNSAFNYQIEKNTRISDFFYNFGIQFHHTFINSVTEKKHRFNFGLILDNKTNLSAKRDTLAGTIMGYNNESINYNSIIDTLRYANNVKGIIVLPRNIGIGFSYNYDNKLTIAADYSMQNWSDVTIFGINDSLSNSNRISAGIEYTPKKYNILKGFSNFTKRVSYRFGAHYSNTYLQFISKDEQLKEFGISFGLGIPIRKGKSSINLFFEFKQRGTTEKDLIKETFGTIGVNFTMYDIWFVKRKYD